MSRPVWRIPEWREPQPSNLLPLLHEQLLSTDFQLHNITSLTFSKTHNYNYAGLYRNVTPKRSSCVCNLSLKGYQLCERITPSADRSTAAEQTVGRRRRLSPEHLF